MRTAIVSIGALLVSIYAHNPVAAQNTQNDNDFLSGIFGQQVPTYQGEPNGGQTNKNKQDDSDELRLGIHDQESDPGDTAEAESETR